MEKNEMFGSFVRTLTHVSDSGLQILKQVMDRSGSLRDGNFDFFSKDLTKFMKDWIPPVILQQITTKTINAIPAGGTFAKPCGIFKYGVYFDETRNEKIVRSISGEQSPKIQASVYQLVHGHTHVDAFEKLGELNQLCLTPGQIKWFCKTHGEFLRMGNWGSVSVFFLFRDGKEVLENKSNLWVAIASMMHFDGDEDYPEHPSGWLEILHIRKFRLTDSEDGHVGNECLFVVPALQEKVA